MIVSLKTLGYFTSASSFLLLNTCFCDAFDDYSMMNFWEYLLYYYCCWFRCLDLLEFCCWFCEGFAYCCYDNWFGFVGVLVLTGLLEFVVQAGFSVCLFGIEVLGRQAFWLQAGLDTGRLQGLLLVWVLCRWMQFVLLVFLMQVWMGCWVLVRNACVYKQFEGFGKCFRHTCLWYRQACCYASLLKV